MSLSLRVSLTVVAHDLTQELRRPIASAAVLLFGFSSMVVLRLALAGGGKPSGAVLAGALWVLLVFAALLGTSRAWANEKEDGAYDALLISPASRSAIHLGKVLAAFIITVVLSFSLLALYLALFSVPNRSGLLILLAVIVLSAGGFSSVGVLVSALSLRAKGRDLLSPAMFLPLVIPLVIASVSLSLTAFGASEANAGQLLVFLLAYDATFLFAGIAAFPELAVD